MHHSPPGDSIRDLFIPKRWRSPLLPPLDGTGHVFTHHPKKGQQKNRAPRPNDQKTQVNQTSKAGVVRHVERLKVSQKMRWVKRATSVFMSSWGHRKKKKRSYFPVCWLFPEEF